MVTAPILPVVSVEEYLNNSYTPDMEYVDGVLIERGVPTIPHSLLQMILIQFFAQFQETLRFVALPQVRTQIIQRARYRIPEVVLCSLPVPKCKILSPFPALLQTHSPTPPGYRSESALFVNGLSAYHRVQRLNVFDLLLGTRQEIAIDDDEIGEFPRFERSTLFLGELNPRGAVRVDTEARLRG